MKKCSKCNKMKPDDAFNKRKVNTNDLQSMCKKCASIVRNERYNKNKDKEKNQSYNNRIKRIYGITKDEYDIMYSKQNGKCAICNSDKVNRNKTDKFCIDHCHNSGKVRGLLCHNCNVLLGKLSDNIELCEKIIYYIKSF